ncbi:MAG TPA: hypothetical protein PKD54_16520, partial [Pirellulaceae bacterium]|nr:hypothetical protein [Pirellulaceae bacterium]
AMGDQEVAPSIRRHVMARAETWWRNRRVQFGMGIATGLLALVGLIAIWSGNTRPPIVREPLDAVIVKSVEWFEELMADEDWEENFHQYMSQYPLDDLIPRKPRRARPFYGNWGVGTVYDLSDSSIAGALLFVVRPSRHFVDQGRLPTEPVYVDSRHAVGAGEHNGCVYILVVRGRPQDYQLLFMTSLTDE